MKRPRAFIFSLLLGLTLPAIAQTPTGADSTQAHQEHQAPLAQLRQRFGGDCQLQAPSTWAHPAKAVIAQRPEARLHWVALCRNAFYPVLGMAFDYDPQGQTKDFFYPLFLALLNANEFWPLSLVETSTGLAIHLDSKGKDELILDYEELPAWPDQ